MTRQRSLTKILWMTLTPLYFILVAIIFYLWIGAELRHEKFQRDDIRNIYISSQKEIIQTRVEHFVDYIRYEKFLAQKKMKPGLNSSMDKAFQDETLKQAIIDHLEQIKHGKNGYIFAATWDGVSLSGPFKGENILHLTDPNGVRIVEELIGAAKSGGGFVDYVAPRFKGQPPAPKLSYVKPLPEWKWYVGTGVYIDSMDSVILEKKKEFQKSVRDLLIKTMVVLCSFFFLSFLLVWFVSRKIKKNLDVFAAFFKRSAEETFFIDENQVYFAEFQPLVVSANQMSRERGKAEKALRESEERFRKLSNLTFEGIVIHREGVAVDANESFTRMFGVTKKELLDKNIIEMFIPHEYRAVVKENLAKERATPYVVMAKRKDGRLFPMEIESKNIKTGPDTYRVTAVRDIMKRKQAEDALKQSEEELKSIFRAAPTGIGLVRNRVISQVNDRFCEIIGYSRDSLIGQSSRMLYSSDEEFEYVGKEKYAQISKKGTGTVETRMQTKDGKIIDVLLSSAPIDLNDVSKGVTFTALDITDHKTKELELLESEKKYRSMMETMEDSAYICSSDYTIEYMNPAMIKRIGSDATGELCHKAIHGLDEKCPWCIYEKIKDTESMNYEIASPKNNKTYHISNSAIYHMDGSYSKLSIFRDITELKKMEARMQQSQKMEAIGTLAGGIAHDFNNILFPIVGHAEMLLEDIPEDSPFRNNLQGIYSSALRAGDLVKQILTFSRQDTNELKLMKMQPIIKEALKLIRSSIPTTIDIKQDIQADCGVIKADPTQIHQIVMNLATNAYHAMEGKGGNLIVTLKEIQLDMYEVTTPDLTQGTYACLTVSDTGMGMDKQLIKKIFDPFFTTKEKGKGTGMGLSVVHGIVNGMGGAVRVYSEPGTGTEFYVYLPVEKNSFENPVIQTKDSIPGGTETILLVDDEDTILIMEKQVLERLGYQVISRTSSLEALEAFRGNPNKFDLVITDMAMPNMSGDRLGHELIRIRPDIPILLCTGFSEKMSEEKVESMGIKGFLLKPIVMKDLAGKIRKILDGNDNKIKKGVSEIHSRSSGQ
ncbi:PAS domain S-box protein [Desulfobacula sp.]|uniref:PAS domain S-box protein n=1 Tax=Desulfobacula sp. TaxID=2593537 RepID=UPI002638FE60|nr:PAS domain S-box protein [Desulfobacula sp.]